MPLRLPALHRHGWLLGLFALGPIWVGATLAAAPGIAARIAAAGERVALATEAGAPEPWLRVSVRGRDLVAEGEAPDPAARAAALARLDALPGPRRVVPGIGLVETASPFAWSATRVGADRIALAGSRPAEIGRAALRTRLAAEAPDATAFADAAHAARGAPPDFPAAAAYAVARLRDLAPDGTATVTDTVLALSGTATDLDAYDALRSALAEPPAGFTVGRVELLPARVPDFAMGVARRPGGGVVLTGFAVSEAARAETVRLAAEIAAGAGIEDRMRTARGLAAGIDPDALARFLVRIAGLMQSGGAAFDGARVSVAGDAVDGQAVGEIEALMREARPAGIGAGGVGLSVKPLSPYRLAIRREAETVSLSGHLPDGDARERLLAAVRPRFFRERILDRTRIADGAPPGLADALAAAVPVLASLAEGEVAVADRALTLTGTGLYREAAARAAVALPAALPAGWSATVAVRPKDAAAPRDPETCRAEAVALVGGTSLRFPPGSTVLAPIFHPVLDRLAALARVCPSLHVAVAGHGDPPGAVKVAEAGPAPAAAASAPTKPAAKAGDRKPGDPGSPHAKPAAKPALAAKDKARDKDRASESPKESAKSVAAEPDMAHLRAGAVVEYLLQAGAGLDQAVVAERPADRPGIVFAVLP